ncbi:MAG: hypothetical protein AB7S80_17880 [Rhizobiaceae bacterium]
MNSAADSGDDGGFGGGGGAGFGLSGGAGGCGGGGGTISASGGAGGFGGGDGTASAAATPGSGGVGGGNGTNQGGAGGGGVTVATGATFEIDKAGPSTLANTVSAGGGFTKNGAGDLQIDSTNTYSGPTNILAGSITTFSAGDNAIGGQSDVTIASGAVLALIAAETVGSLSGSGRAGGTGADPRVLTVGGSGNDANFTGVLGNNAFGGVGAPLTLNKIGSGRAAWAWNAVNARAITAAFQALPGQTFTVNGARPARNSAPLDLGIEASFDNGLAAKLSFNGEFSRNVSSFGASARLCYRS